jgi:hypothetical protein
MPTALVLSMLASNASTVSLEVSPELACPRPAQVTARLTEAGVKVVPAYGGLEVKLTPTDSGLTITARRAIDGKTYHRAVKAAANECETVEHLVSVMVSAWVNPELPVLSPKRPFRTPHPLVSTDGGEGASP